MHTFVFAMPSWSIVVAVVLLASACASTQSVLDRTWYWLDAQPPESYTLQIHGDRAAVRADCNRGTGTVALKGGQVTFGPMATTRAFCPPPSRGDEYARQLQSATRFSVHADVLRLELKDGGAMFFAAGPKARVAHYRCREQRMLSVVYEGDTAHVWYEGAHYALERERSASGARYGDGGVTLDTQGVMGSLRKGDAFLARNCQLPSR